VGKIGGNATIGAAVGKIGGNATIGAAVGKIGGNATIGAAVDKIGGTDTAVSGHILTPASRRTTFCVFCAVLCLCDSILDPHHV
jgi:hypothetical protein